MINFEEIDNKYFVFSDYDIGKYGPFDSLWVKGIFQGEEFIYDFSDLKSWKNTVGILNSKIYLFEEENGKLKYLTK
ncbi:MAG: hypothetical protein PHE25_01885 [Candidatus Gracilibacteria bacterium]|nr:hypothetical protein [Candidatus Gracilibacteria bacterium]